jgi:hypothetical protein
VKVWLKNHAKPVSGPLEWLTGKRYNPNDEPRFKVRSLEFVISEVESMVRDDEEGFHERQLLALRWNLETLQYSPFGSTAESSGTETL